MLISQNFETATSSSCILVTVFPRSAANTRSAPRKSPSLTQKNNSQIKMEYFCWFTARSPALLLVFRQEAPSAAPPAAEEAQRRPRGGGVQYVGGRRSATCSCRLCQLSLGSLWIRRTSFLQERLPPVKAVVGSVCEGEDGRVH